MKKIKDTILYNGKWLIFQERTLINKHGQEIQWEMVRRNGDYLGVIVLARLMPSDRYIIIRQYRPAIEGYVIGFVAGMAYGEIEQEALRELKEETGYTGRVVDVSPLLKSGVGIMNEDCRFVKIDIDENDPVNAYPLQELEHSEDIEVLAVPKKEMADFLRQAAERGDSIGSGVWAYFCMER
jgi:ADP-ribose pyrophosphatase